MTQYQSALLEARKVTELLARLESELGEAAGICVGALAAGGKLLVCGNGGSACDAQHLVGELVGRYKKSRRPLAAIALNADGAALTCIANDFSYEEVFARQVEALGRAGDIVIVFTTSGQSPSVLACLRKAREMGLRTIAFLGKDGGAAAGLAECPLVVRHAETARIQEGHQFLMHALMDAVEARLGLSGLALPDVGGNEAQEPIPH